MAIRVALKHETHYRYASPSALGPQTIRLRPAPHNRTPVHRYSLAVQPREHFLNWQQDPYGNYMARVVFPERAPEFHVTVDLVLDLEAYSPFDFFLEPAAEEFPFRYEEALRKELEPFLETDPSDARLDAFVQSFDRSPRRTVDFLVDANRRVTGEVAYRIRMDPGVQTPSETLQRGEGSCRDSAWLLVQSLRRLGLAARFASGYLIQLEPDQRPVRGPVGPEQDFTDLHAWCECYVPGAGWIGLDPTSGLFAAEGHVPLACTPRPESAAPIEGGVEKVETDFSFDMQVTRVVDRPRVTKPYDDAQWQAILGLGDRVDEALAHGDVRLSVGGEPTFVSSEHPDEPEWNVAALGPTKAPLADRLFRRLFELWGPGGMLHHGEGKWYPGEPVPRWAFGCYYRRDGVAVWNDATRFAKTGQDQGHDSEHAERFARRLIEHLALERHGLMPAHEDAWYYAWRERKLPCNVEALDSHLDDPMERARLRRIFHRGLGATVGWVLPLGYDDGWVSGDWFLRDERCLLLPGDSPMGLRLPLDGQPFALEHHRDSLEPRDPRAPGRPLASHHRFPLASRETLQPRLRRSPLPAEANRDGVLPATLADPFVRPALGESAQGITRTALCVEPRQGILRVFLPPLTDLAAYLELVAAIERTASDLDVALQLEGYPPPRDPRISEFKVTPDPGVIEVNVPPTTGWRGAVRQTEELYEAARQELLVAEKFDVDGTHVGSGGGNHLVLGGLNPVDSPFLRRPDVLSSLLRFWHNHPSLSYLFAGRFIGPTSQAPRVDEARNDSTYELEIALARLQTRSDTVPAWLVDRVLRHLLVDVTGNTHRAEFCIDKMYSPDSVTGRLGLLEMRAFEMPPHERMSAVQQLLVRSLLAAFWREPYSAELVKWGTRLHDEFMLPFYVWSDLRGVVDSLEGWGYRLELDWFRPHYEFRFPRHGEVVLDDLQLEVRGALEPWLVLGEESAAGGQARYVDSSVERLQLSVEGWVEERYALLCNRYRVPLQPTGRVGRFVAGVRFRAWQPPSCLHPTIGIHAPLQIDVYDRWSGRSVGGCTYHVEHPGGRGNDDRPVNAAAAESRRQARFEARGHSAGCFEPLHAGTHDHFPHTLDLRRT